jgi:hypothetical protein
MKWHVIIKLVFFGEKYWPNRFIVATNCAIWTNLMLFTEYSLHTGLLGKYVF